MAQEIQKIKANIILVPVGRNHIFRKVTGNQDESLLNRLERTGKYNVIPLIPCRFNKPDTHDNRKEIEKYGYSKEYLPTMTFKPSSQDIIDVDRFEKAIFEVGQHEWHETHKIKLMLNKIGLISKGKSAYKEYNQYKRYLEIKNQKLDKLMGEDEYEPIENEEGIQKPNSLKIKNSPYRALKRLEAERKFQEKIQENIEPCC